MNTTKLHIISTRLKEDLQKTKSLHLINQMIQALENQIAQPQQKNHASQLSQSWQQLQNNLAQSSTIMFSPAWREAMDELEVAEFFGEGLKNEIETIFQANQITQQIALDQLKVVFEDIKQIDHNLNNLCESLSFFDVGEDFLEPNECEIGLIIPRAFVRNNMKSFGDELVHLEKMLLSFSELTTNSREPLKIRQISSSELSVFLDYLPEIAAAIAFSVERLTQFYKTLLEIKALRQQMIQNEVPEESLQGIDKHIEQKARPYVEQLAEELMQKYGQKVPEARKNELRTELKYSLNKLLNRLDHGLNVEIRVTNQEQENNDEDEQNPDPAKQLIQEIEERSANITHLANQQTPILSLPESEDQDDAK